MWIGVPGGTAFAFGVIKRDSTSWTKENDDCNVTKKGI